MEWTNPVTWLWDDCMTSLPRAKRGQNRRKEASHDVPQMPYLHHWWSDAVRWYISSRASAKLVREEERRLDAGRSTLQARHEKGFCYPANSHVEFPQRVLDPTAHLIKMCSWSIHASQSDHCLRKRIGWEHPTLSQPYRYEQVERSGDMLVRGPGAHAPPSFSPPKDLSD